MASLDFANFGVLSFDCYGTLIDWETGICDALVPLLKRHGLAVDRETLLASYAKAESQIESGNFLRYQDVLRNVVYRIGEEFEFEPDSAEAELLPASVSKWPPFPDTAVALKRLHKKFRLAVISNVDDDLFSGTAQALSVKFDWIITAEQAGAYKPSQAVFEHAYRQIGIPREGILHVAQSLYHDIAPARNLGQKCVWINRRRGLPGRGATPPSDAVPDLELPSLSALADMVERSKSY